MAKLSSYPESSALVDTDEVAITTPAVKRISWANLKAQLSSQYATVNFAAKKYGLYNAGSGSHTALIQDALDLAGTTAAARVNFAAASQAPVEIPLFNQDYNVGPLSVPAGVKLTGDGARLVANASGWIVTLAGDNASVEGIRIMGQFSLGRLGGGFRAMASNNRITNCSTIQTAYESVRAESSSYTTRIAGHFCHSAWSDPSALVAPAGAIHLLGYDPWLLDSEFGCSRGATFSSAGQYVCGAVLSASNVRVARCISEFNDHGFYIAGDAGLQMSDCRSEFNAGHGYYFNGGQGQVVGCQAHKNSRAATNTYDGFYLTGSNKMSFSTCRTKGDAATPYNRWGFNDASSASDFNHVAFDSTCVATDCSTGAMNTAYGKVAARSGRYTYVAAGATTINVAANGWPDSNFTLNSTSAVTMTGPTGGVQGQDLYIFGDGFTTFTHGAYANFRCLSGANTLAVGGALYHFHCFNSVWMMTAIA